MFDKSCKNILVRGVNWIGDSVMTLPTFLAGIKERTGYKRDGRGILLTKTVPVPQNEKKVHQINYYLNLLEQIGIKAEYSYPYIYLSLDERLQARKFLQDMKR